MKRLFVLIMLLCSSISFAATGDVTFIGPGLQSVPLPTTTTVGGVKAKVPVAGTFVTGLATDGGLETAVLDAGYLVDGYIPDGVQYGVANVETYGTLEEAIDTIGDTPKTLRFSSDLTLAANVEIPATLELVPLNGAKIIHAAYTISYAGSTARWDSSQIFDGTGAVTLSGATEILPEYFGTNTTPGTTDMTTAVQKAIATGYLSGRPIALEATTYLITDTLTLRRGQTVRGEHKHSFANGKLGPFATVIQFAPTSTKDCFYVQYALADDGSGYTVGVRIKDLSIVGNTTGGVTYSRYAVDANRTSMCEYSNVYIKRFQVGVNCLYTMTNNFSDIFIQECSVACVKYSTHTGISTSDVWTRCRFNVSPWGVIIEYAYAVRFVDCLLESLSVGGCDIWKESYGIQWTNGYAEDVPTADTATLNCFQVGVNGTTPVSNAEKLQIIGGTYGGRNAGFVGAFIDADYAQKISVIGGTYSRYTNFIRTTANTTDWAVFVIGGVRSTISTFANDLTKVHGTYINSEISGSQGPRIRGSVLQATTAIELSSTTLQTGSGSPEGAVAATVGSIFLRVDGGATTTLYVKTSGTGNTGWTAK